MDGTAAADRLSVNKGKNVDLNGDGGFRPHTQMTVQAPRREDLQKSYASVVDNVDVKGWYGAMSAWLMFSVVSRHHTPAANKPTL